MATPVFKKVKNEYQISWYEAVGDFMKGASKLRIHKGQGCWELWAFEPYKNGCLYATAKTLQDAKELAKLHFSF